MPDNPPFNAESSDFIWLLGQFGEIVYVLIFVVFAVTLVAIMWQIINAWIIHGGESTKVTEGKKTILIGIIVLTIMSAIWGIVALLRSSII